MKMIMLSILLLATVGTLSGAPVVSNLTVAQRSDNTKMVDVWFDLTNSLPMTVTLLVSDDNGVSWDVSCNLTSGDIGPGISPGSGKHIVWDVLAEHPGINGDQFKFKIIADDGTPPPVPENFILVEGGTFNPATTYTVTLSSFYIDKYEVTQQSYVAVMGSNPSYFTGDLQRPVEQVRWYDTIVYCNERSLQEGLTPCYSYLTYGTDPDNWPAGWNAVRQNHLNVNCDWSANGYRLPTEMEWQFAAMGGNFTHNYTYSGSNYVAEVGWFYSNSGNTTHPVGTKNPNELGLYDMSGNVWEWCWDIYGDYPSGAYTDPKGPTSGTYRDARGGSYHDPQSYCGVALRVYNFWDYWGQYAGFRICRNTP